MPEAGVRHVEHATSILGKGFETPRRFVVETWSFDTHLHRVG